LSPQHGVYLLKAAGLIRARHLVGISPRVGIAKGLQSISYHYLLLPQHDLLLAEGARVESFYPGAMALAALPVVDRAAVAPRFCGSARLVLPTHPLNCLLQLCLQT